jgi:hypothetical protein
MIAMACVAAGLTLTFCLPVEAAAPGAMCRHSACRTGLQCKDMVDKKGVKGATWKAEYAKCKADPASYN